MIMSKVYTLESELTNALFRLSFGKLTYEQAVEIAKKAAPNFDMNNEALPHKGINWYAKELLKLLRGIDCRINLIRFHAIPNVDLEGVSMDEMIQFRDYLTSHGLFTTIRASRGEDIFAACGMLSTLKQKQDV